MIFHAALCEVASPDGVVGREWCYVEVKLPGQPIVAHIRGRVRVGHGNGHVRLREFMVAYVRVCVWGSLCVCVCGGLRAPVGVWIRVRVFLFASVCSYALARWRKRKLARTVLAVRVPRIGSVGCGEATGAWFRHLFCKRLRRAIAHRGLIMKRCGCALQTHSVRRTMNWVK